MTRLVAGRRTGGSLSSVAGSKKVQSVAAFRRLFSTEVAMPFDIDQSVKQVVPAITGKIQDVRYDPHSKSFSYLVSYEADGETHSRWFDEKEVEAAQ